VWLWGYELDDGTRDKKQNKKCREKKLRCRIDNLVIMNKLKKILNDRGSIKKWVYWNGYVGIRLLHYLPIISISSWDFNETPELRVQDRDVKQWGESAKR